MLHVTRWTGRRLPERAEIASKVKPIKSHMTAETKTLLLLLLKLLQLLLLLKHGVLLLQPQLILHLLVPRTLR